METASDAIAAPSRTKANESPLPKSEDAQILNDMTVASLQLLPAPHVAKDAKIEDALNIARAHNGECVLVLSGNKPTGFLSLVDLAANEGNDTSVSEVMQPFAGTREEPKTPETFRVITPDTPLGDLSAFLQDHPFALVTDASRESVLGVASRGDIDRLIARLGLGEHPTPLGRRAEDESTRDRSLVEFMHMLDDYAPLIPDEVSDFYLERAGFQTDDVRLKRLLALAAEKFVSDIASDAFQYARIRTNAASVNCMQANSN
ncbi:hypothetical protein MCUN1_001757 [Malassezia cuniculi]|uniref:CBS domain-containing protein n=1 Tax=Malassezia cuniculi TaxID=948313 RepID=A0AAF0EYA8_9BASI|nr:hypothetical protein MCUN1_001757 [Malassezia cuniculi]